MELRISDWTKLAVVMFQSPISGVNDWNWTKLAVVISVVLCFSLLLAELMIGTIEKRGHYAHVN